MPGQHLLGLRARPGLGRLMAATRITPLVHHQLRHSSTAAPRRGPGPLTLTLTSAVALTLGLSIGTLYGRLTSPSKPLQLESHGPNSTSSSLNGPVYAPRMEQLHAAEEIARLLGQDAVAYDEDELEARGHSDWSTSNSPERAVAVVYPRSTEDVVTIAKICNRRNVPMVPYGAGSSVEGNFSQPHGGIIIDFRRMDQVVAVHPEDMDVVVQPGVNWVELNKRLTQQGLFFPMDPSPTATIGGMVSTNCSGTNAFRYGTMKDWVVNLTVVLPDGRVVKTRRRPRKSSAGYNLTQLFVGAEGTLGMVTEITLKLAPVPEETSVAVVPFRDVKDAAAGAAALIRAGITGLAAIEIMDERQMEILNKYGSATVKQRHWAEQPTLFLKFAATKETIGPDILRTERILTEAVGKVPFEFARTKEEEHALWAGRKESLFTMASIRPEGTQMWSTDVAVPISRLADMIEWSKKECSQLGIFASVVGHVGDGNFHVAMMYDPRDKEQTAAVERCVKGMMKKALEMEGTVSGEHGIGIGKKGSLREEVGEETIELMRRIKRAVDPKWVMNPGKIFDWK